MQGVPQLQLPPLEVVGAVMEDIQEELMVVDTEEPPDMAGMAVTQGATAVDTVGVMAQMGNFFIRFGLVWVTKICFY